MGLHIKAPDPTYIRIPGRSAYIFSSIQKDTQAAICIFAVILDDPAHMAFIQELITKSVHVKPHVVYMGSLLGYGEVDVAHQMFKPIHFVDFVIDCVDPDLWINDQTQIKRFMSGMTRDVKRYAIEKASKVRHPAQLAPANPEAASNVVSIISPELAKNQEKVKSGLQQLGFKKPRINDFMKSYQGSYEDPSKVMVDAITFMNR